jgi:predicted nucleotidyltransferase component of viral defense system
LITRPDIDDRVREWGLREDVVEKDYVLGWLLWGIGTDPVLSSKWVFKGGTCLKKCYIETYRFSEDLDFTILPDGPVSPADLSPLLPSLLQRVGDESGIDFGQRPPMLKGHDSGQYTEGRIYYIGPRNSPTVASVKLDLSASERLVRDSVSRKIAHSYPDALPEPATVLCYSCPELFAEKIRAMGERGRPRDLYDIINLFRQQTFGFEPDEISAVLDEKCRVKGIAAPTFESVTTPDVIAELKAAWANMLQHQLPTLPPVDKFLSELEHLFHWLAGRERKVLLTPIPALNDGPIEISWTPPATVQTWGISGVPMEAIRYAAANRLCVELKYNGTTRVIEPYTLRRTRAGKILLMAVKVPSREDRSYRIDRIQGARVTDQSFTPRYQIEMTPTGPISAPTFSPARPRSPSSSTNSYSSSGTFHVVKCGYCGKLFYRTTYDTHLNDHNMKASRNRCSGSGGYGIYIGIRRRK